MVKLIKNKKEDISYGGSRKKSTGFGRKTGLCIKPERHSEV
jgi:hypothetical protein